MKAPLQALSRPALLTALVSCLQERKKVEGIIATMQRKYNDEISDLHATADQLLMVGLSQKTIYTLTTRTTNSIEDCLMHSMFVFSLSHTSETRTHCFLKTVKDMLQVFLKETLNTMLLYWDFKWK